MINIKKQNSFIIPIVIIIVIMIFHFSGLIKPLENFFLYISKPVAVKIFKNSANLDNSYKNSQSKIDYFKRIEELERNVAELTVSEAAYLETLDENQKLKDSLSFSEESGYKLLSSSVIAGEIIDQSNRDITINRGEVDGLTVGLAVVDEQGVLVGKIIETKKSISHVCLLINSNCDFASAILNHDKTQGIVSGNMGLTIKMSYIPQSENVSIGDIVITSGLGSGIPRGLVIGRISQVNSEDKDIWQEAIIEPQVNFNNLTIVSVVMP